MKTCVPCSLFSACLLSTAFVACSVADIDGNAVDASGRDIETSSDADIHDQNTRLDAFVDVSRVDLTTGSDLVDRDTRVFDNVVADSHIADGSVLAPSGCISGEFNLARANLHSHTSYSDGEQTPADAFAYARNVADLDVLVVSDHVEQLYFFNPSDRWDLCREQAGTATEPGQFAALCGFEYGSGYGILESDGHCNVFFANDLFPAVQLDFHDFYDSLLACPNCIGQFNHPGDESSQHFEHFSYYADVDENMNLYEFNGSGDTWGLYFQALDAGWHVSPVINQDNHAPNWGTANSTRSGLYLSSLTREAVYDAMRARRSFASFDQNASLRVRTNHGCWMGSILTTHTGFDLNAEADDDDDGFAAIDFWGPGRTLLQSTSCNNQRHCEATYHVAADCDTYVIPVALQSDGETVTAAPFWVQLSEDEQP
jgi:hypothetical protein